MRQLNALLKKNSELTLLTQQLSTSTKINQFWHSAIPNELKTCCQAFQLQDGILTVVTTSALAASKIKLTQASLLNALENSRKINVSFSTCKVTAIKVKVQVKSIAKPVKKRIKSISSTGAQHLTTLAKKTQGSALGDILNRLASKHHTK